MRMPSEIKEFYLLTIPRNLPNQLTIFRLGLACLLFVILQAIGWAQKFNDSSAGFCGDLAQNISLHQSLFFNLGAMISLLALISDIADGYIARRWNLMTDFGRIADPFADKVIVVGAFVFLIPIAHSGVSAWMVVVLATREMLVDGLRGFAESRGIAFGASGWGKAKMVSQSMTIVLIMAALANFPRKPWVDVLISLLLAWTLFITVYSGALYLVAARSLLSKVPKR